MARRLLPGSVSLANVVASSYNFDELPALVRHFHAMGVYTYVTPVMIAAEESRDYRFRAVGAEFVVRDGSDARRTGVLDELVALRRSGHGLTNSTRHLRDYRRYLETGVCAWRCDAGELSLDVLPDGGVSICKEKPPFGNILDTGFLERHARGDFRERNRRTAAACSGCFYGEYREPQYAVRNAGVLAEWVLDYFRTFRHGMRFNPSAHAGAAGETDTSGPPSSSVSSPAGGSGPPRPSRAP